MLNAALNRIAASYDEPHRRRTRRNWNWAQARNARARLRGKAGPSLRPHRVFGRVEPDCARSALKTARSRRHSRRGRTRSAAELAEQIKTLKGAHQASKPRAGTDARAARGLNASASASNCRKRPHRKHQRQLPKRQNPRTESPTTRTPPRVRFAPGYAKAMQQIAVLRSCVSTKLSPSLSCNNEICSLGQKILGWTAAGQRTCFRLELCRNCGSARDRSQRPQSYLSPSGLGPLPQATPASFSG